MGVNQDEINTKAREITLAMLTASLDGDPTVFNEYMSKLGEEMDDMYLKDAMAVKEAMVPHYREVERRAAAKLSELTGSEVELGKPTGTEVVETYYAQMTAAFLNEISGLTGESIQVIWQKIALDMAAEPEG
jgi:hypothetical protein